jgi:pimeloyl-ACP methyl ester carboxylesterase
MRARIDLGKPYVITQIYLYDFNGKAPVGTSYKVDAEVSAGVYQNIVSTDLAAYKAWKRFDVSVTTSALAVETPGYVGMPEIVVYGYEENHAPVLNSISNQTMNAGTSRTLNLSASDPDYDQIQIKAVGTLPSYAKLTDIGNGTAVLVLTPKSTDVGTKSISIRATDPDGLGSTRTFSVTVNAVTVGKGVQVERQLGTTPAKMGYLEFLPGDYATTSAPYPLVLFFHGIGERGNGTTELFNVAKNGPPLLAKNGRQFPAIVISPQLPKNKGSWPTADMTEFLNYVIGTYRVDMKRIYVTGLSLGGGGAWVAARDNLNLVAAVVPICGYAATTGYDALKGLPVWAFHHEVDTTVAYSSTTGKLKQITGINPESNRPQDNQTPGYTAGFDGAKWIWALGQAAPPVAQNPILTTYEGSSHNSWSKAYNNEAMWTWLFKQTK